MSEFMVSPGELRRLAARMDEAAGRAAGINGRAVDGLGGATRGDFPARSEGQRMAADWERARSTFVDGISLVRSGIDRFAANVHSAANQYEQTDKAAANDVSRSGRSRNRAE
jgi:hypothetical protein